MILRPYQEVGRDFLASRKCALLADEMRVGKTPQAILAAHVLGAQTVLVVCPAIAVPHWETEIKKWWPGDALPRVNILSYNRAVALWQRNECLTSDVFIVDECHYAKNPAALRTKAVYGISGFAMKADATWALSGTPAPKHAGELWPMLRAFGVTGQSYHDFLNEYCTFDWTGRITGTNAARIPEIKVMLATVMLRRTRAEVAPDMPAIDFQFLEVKGDFSTLAPSLISDAEVERYIDAGLVCGDKQNRTEVAAAKVQPLADEIVAAIKEGQIAQTVVFGWHVEPLRTLARTLRQAGVYADTITGSASPYERAKLIEDFQKGDLQVVVANIQAAGTAIDLSAASHGYFLELDWVGVNNLQAANRLVSMQKKEPVTFDICTWPGSFDDRVQRVVARRMSEIRNMGLA